MGLGHLALFAACGSFGRSCGLGAAGGLNTLGGGGTRRLFRLAQILFDTGVGDGSLLNPRGGGGLACGSLCDFGSGLGFGLGDQCLLSYLFGGTVAKLCAILPPRSRKVTILSAVKVRP
jgi:hypothetical protein